MKLGKRIAALSLVLTTCLALAACGDSNLMKDAKEYTNKGGSFSIKGPDNWTESTVTNDDMLILDNSDQSLTIMVQRFPKEEASVRINSLDEFVTTYNETPQIKSLIAQADTKPEVKDVTIEGMTGAKAEEISATQSGTTAKAYVVMIESEKAYYSFIITGLEKEYDKNIESLKESVESLTEK